MNFFVFVFVGHFLLPKFEKKKNTQKFLFIVVLKIRFKKTIIITELHCRNAFKCRRGPRRTVTFCPDTPVIQYYREDEWYAKPINVIHIFDSNTLSI